MKDVEGKSADESLGEEQIDDDNLETHPSSDINRRGAEFKGRIRVTIENRAQIIGVINMIIRSHTSLKDKLLGHERIKREIDRDSEPPLNLDAEILNGVLIAYLVAEAEINATVDEIKQLIEKVDPEYFNQYPPGEAYEYYRKGRMREMNLMSETFLRLYSA